ncbi:MAG TPA: class I SAM-dependent methyltransferase [Chitinophagaceae bacterium]|nr:class I SAM-dependent methyltransferase [Chitinophagaceae bacterium]
MLDVACGRGRYAKLLAAEGFPVVGFDLSPDSIAYAKQFESANLSFYQHDMRLPFWINYFDYVFNFFTSFGYFRTRHEHDAAVGTMAASLRQKGLLVIDYLNVHFTEDHLVPAEENILGNTVFTIHRWQDEWHFFKKIQITDPSLETPLLFTEELRKLTLDDFTGMLSFRNLQVKEVFGDYQLSAYTSKTSPRLIMIAEKENIT